MQQVVPGRQGVTLKLPFDTMEAAPPSSSTPFYDALSPRHRRFVDRYIAAGMVAWKAYRAIYTGEGEATYTYLSTAASRLMTNDDIRAAIAERMAALCMTDTEAAAIIGEHARGSLAPFLRIDQRTGLVEVDLASEEALANLHLLRKIKQRKRITKDPGGKTRVTLEHDIEIHDPQAAAHKIRQAHGAYKERVEVTGHVATTITFIEHPPRQRGQHAALNGDVVTGEAGRGA